MEMERDKHEEQENIHEVDTIDNHRGGELQNESDLSDRDDHHEEDATSTDDHKHADYSNFTKAQLVDVLKEVVKSTNYRHADDVLREVRPFFDDIREKERSNALAKFVADGGTEQDFEYKGDDLDIAFDANYKLIKDRKAQFMRDQEDQKNTNLTRKLELLEKLRELVDTTDTNIEFDAFKELQEEWKTIGPVPGAQAKSVWANYHALIDRFYDNQSIYFELKELDRKRNLEAKMELCARAEKLGDVTIIKDAIRELNELHHEFKHIGPVPKDEKEAVWQRFKTASDAVYARRDEYVQSLQQELGQNLDVKGQLGDEVQAFADFQSDRIKEWNQKTKEILDLQKRWETVGGLPRAKAKEVNKKFWSAFKAFFNNKNNFFKKLDEEREQNMHLKNELLQKAIDLKDSTEWDKTSNELKALQQKWKEVGPVPEKFREKIFMDFKAACDHFFEQRRGQQGRLENEQVENLKVKEEVCVELEKHADEGTATTELLDELQQRYGDAGFVPKKDIGAIRGRYHSALDKFIQAIPELDEEAKAKLSLESQISELRNDPMADRKIYQKEQAIRKKISKVENDIALWRNNLEFFSRSQNADQVRSEFNDKIKYASDHLKQLKQQLKLLRTV